MLSKEENDAKFADLGKAHGEDNVKRIDTASGMLVVSRPSRNECRRAAQMGLLAPSSPGYGDAIESLARACIKHPTPEVFDTMLDREPLLYLKLAPAMLELAGLRNAEEGKG